MAVHIRGTVGQALGQVQLEIGKAFGIETAAEAIDGRFADIGQLGEGGNAGVNGGLGRRQDHFSHLTL
ncbi:hypothetical protein D3C72_1393600 [compost metagenome]